MLLVTISAKLGLLGLLAQVPNPAPQPPPGLQESADRFISWLKWGGLVGGMIGMVVCGIMMMVGRRNRSATAVDGATGIPWVLGGLTVVALASGIVGSVLQS